MSRARTWKCPQCGLTLEVSYDWLAEHGGPVCEHCDSDMELQAAADDRIQRLVGKAEAAGLEPEDVDELVHELAASIAADINNGGLDDQIRYLVDEMGVEQTEKQIDDLIASQPREEGE
jgi:hypothetical protein